MSDGEHEVDFGSGFNDEDSKLQAREESWTRGEHTTSKGQTLRLEEMATPHLQNTINKFKGEGYDTSALEAELAKRTQ